MQKTQFDYNKKQTSQQNHSSKKSTIQFNPFMARFYLTKLIKILFFAIVCLKLNCNDSIVSEPIMSLVGSNSYENFKISGKSGAICGDGNTIDGVQECDDGNLENNDGCDSSCHIETNFTCQISISRLSTCKYNQPIKVSYSGLSKSLDSNTLHIIFTIQPAHLKIWSSQRISKFINNVQITKQINKKTIQIPFILTNSIFHAGRPKNQAQLWVSYQNVSLLDCFIRFKVDPENANIPVTSLTEYKSIKTKLLRDPQDEVLLYNYSIETYEFKKRIEVISTVLGYIYMAVAFLGFLFPVGKLSVVYMAMVAQIAYFTSFQYDLVPLTFMGLNGLVNTNGFNWLASSNIQQEDFSKNIGFKSTLMLANYNLTFVVFCLLPFVLGGIILTIIMVFNKQKQNDSKIHDESTLRLSSVKYPSRLQILKILASRIFHECTFYGLIFGGYLTWMSLLHFFKQSGSSVGNCMYAVLVILLQVLFFILHMKKPSQTSYLKQHGINELKKQDKTKENFRVSTYFGSFQQSINDQLFDKKPNRHKIFILGIMLEKIVFSAMIIFASDKSKFVSGIIIVYYLIILSSAIQFYPSANNKDNYMSVVQSQNDKNILIGKRPVHILTQKGQFIFTIVIIILVQMFYISLNIAKEQALKASQRQLMFSNHLYFTRILPILILVLLLINLVYHGFTFAFQVKKSNLREKTKLIIQILCQSTQNSTQQPDERSSNVIMDDSIDKERHMETQISTNKNTSRSHYTYSSEHILMDNLLQKSQKSVRIKQEKGLQQRIQMQSSNLHPDLKKDILNDFRIEEVESQYETEKNPTIMNETNFNYVLKDQAFQVAPNKKFSAFNGKKLLKINSKPNVTQDPHLQTIKMDIEPGYELFDRNCLFTELDQNQKDSENQSVNQSPEKDEEYERVQIPTSNRIIDSQAKKDLLKNIQTNQKQ